jgi:hypothetical protein
MKDRFQPTSFFRQKNHTTNVQTRQTYVATVILIYPNLQRGTEQGEQ